MNKKYGLYILVLVAAALLYKFSGVSNQKQQQSPVTITTGNAGEDDFPIDRNTLRLIYTKHARCRMGCRHIDETEVKEILHKGVVNYHKSQYQNTNHPKYAVEGWSHDRQHLRIVFAPEKEALVVVTCIDLENEFDCHCPGDENKN